MKLASISESWLLQKMREKLGAAGYFNNPMASQNDSLKASSGFDSGSRVTGATSYTTGVPTSPRKRKFLGLSNRPNSIVL